VLIDRNVRVAAELGERIGDVALRRNNLLLRDLKPVLRQIEGLPRRGLEGRDLLFAAQLALPGLLRRDGHELSSQ